MASVTSINVNPPGPYSAGQRIILTPVINNASQIFTGTVYDDSGGSASVQIEVQAGGLTFTTDASKKGMAGFITLVLSPGAPATATVDPNGIAFDLQL